MSAQPTVLLTGGRAPGALHLARALHARGCRVLSAESVATNVTAFSNAVAKSLLVPPPRTEPAAFVAALADIAVRESVSLILPTCEETLYVAWGADRLRDHCRVLAGPWRVLERLHHKGQFIVWAESLHLPAPKTIALDGDQAPQALHDWATREDVTELALKPAFSRFGNHARRYDSPTAAAAALHSNFHGDFRGGWVAQQWLDGDPYCVYALCRSGRLQSFVCYAPELTAGGAGVCFRSLRHEAIEQWTSDFVAAAQLDGQMSFDFIDTPDRGPLPIECNPRMTSGVHFIADQPEFLDLLLGGETTEIVRPRQETVKIASAMLTFGLGSVRSFRALGVWLSRLALAPDAIFRFSDLGPAWGQFAGLAAFMQIARAAGVSTLDASTIDIAWDGVPIDVPDGVPDAPPPSGTANPSGKANSSGTAP